MKLSVKNKSLPNKTVNKSGGVAFTVTNPTERLIFLAGNMFNEPRYYADPTDTDKTGNSLNSEAQELIETVKQVLNSDTPADLFAIARWARDKEKGLKLRTTPGIMLAVAAEDARPGNLTVTPKEVRRHGNLIQKYASAIMARADEPRDVFSAWTALFGTDGKRRTRQVPQALKKAICSVLLATSEYQLAKYSSNGNGIVLGDLIKACAREHIGVPKFLYFVNQDAWANGGQYKTPSGKMYPKDFSPAEATPVLWARYLLAKKKVWDAEAKKLAKDGNVEWEILLSQFGSNESVRKELWQEQVIRMGYMALIRNLRNMIDDKVDLFPVLTKLRDHDLVHKSGMLPFQYLTALQALGYISFGADTDYIHTPGVFTKSTDATAIKILDTIDEALDAAIENLPEISGNTAVFVDVSGSMSQRVSKENAMSMKGAGAVLGAIFHKKSKDGYVVVFGQHAAIVPLKKRDTVLTNVQKAMEIDVGHSTIASAAIKELIKKNIKVDRIVVISDCQIYSTYGGASFDSYCNEYRKFCGTDVWFHVINLAGTPQSPTNPGKNIALFSGFSENLVQMIASVEAKEELVTVKKELPTIQEIRENWYL